MRFDARVDQAEGLRRLLVRNHTQVVLLLTGKAGVGRTSTTINLASALSKLGKAVLVLDENHSSNNIADQLGLHGRYDLLDIAQQKCKPEQALLSKHGFSVLPAARAINSLAQMNRQEQQRLGEVLAEVADSTDVMLVEVAMPVLMQSPDLRQCYQQTMARPMLMSRENGVAGLAGVSSGFASGVTLLVVMDATVSGITDSYALIKKLALESACLQFEIVVNRVADERAAKLVFENMAKVALRKLSVRLEYLGCIPRDDRFKRASRYGAPVSEAYPAAIPANSYRDIAQGLLRLPMQKIETGRGMRAAVQGLMGKVTQPVPQHSKNVAHAVNL